MQKCLIVVAVVLLLTVAKAEVTSYRGYHVVEATPVDTSQLQAIRELEYVDFWRGVKRPGVPVTILVAPEQLQTLQEFLSLHHIKHKVIIEDVQTVFDEERRSQTAAPPADGRITFDRYYRHEEINAYLTELAAQYPDLATVTDLGSSTESRRLQLLTISRDTSANHSAVFVDAGIHGAEWIGPAMALYVVQQLVENATNADLLDGLDWHILPVVNPDGYEFAHDRNRLWRKTRSFDNATSSCYGVDGNRNYGHHWNEGGSSDDPCDFTYHGASAFSEPETRAVKSHFDDNKDNIKLYLTLHSFGEDMLYPWGYTETYPDNWEELEALAHAANDAQVSAGGNSYRVGQSTVLYGFTSGDSDDYGMGVCGIPLAYTIELPGGGLTGFDLPPSEILPTVTPFFEAFRVFGEYVRELATSANNIKPAGHSDAA